MKRIISAILIMLMLFTMGISANAVELSESNESAAKLGDVDCNGHIDAGDALLILKHVAKLNDEIDIKVADLTGDGTVSARDALYVLQVAAGLRELPNEETPVPTHCTIEPTVEPSELVTVEPTISPTEVWTAIPTMAPTPTATLIPIDSPCPEKPVIYLYPEVETEVSVKLDFNGKLTSTYPSYKDGWKVIAKPDGTLYDKETDREYYCLFWEGIANHKYDFAEGFVVAGNDTKEFLEWALDELGLNAKEANEFIIYWLPRMEGNKFNLISFQEDVYTDNAKLDIKPAPDSILRVFMAYKAIEKPIDIKPQSFMSFERKGFTVVEWGGAECFY